MNHELNQRVELLEIRLSHYEAAIDELTRALLRQEHLLKEQSQTIERLHVQLRALARSPVAAPEDETPPPHY